MKPPRSSSFCNALETAAVNTTDLINQQAAELDQLLVSLQARQWMEAVPADMMTLFTDEQWPHLVFELQPASALAESSADLVGLRQRLDRGEAASGSLVQGSFRWLLLQHAEELRIRPLDAFEFEMLSRAAVGQAFGALADYGWPDRPEAERHQAMTDQLMRWLNESLIVDVGVPLPESAEFEDEPDAATRSYASSRGRETGSR